MLAVLKPRIQICFNPLIVYQAKIFYWELDKKEDRTFFLSAAQAILYTLLGQHAIWHTVFSVLIHEMFHLAVKK